MRLIITVEVHPTFGDEMPDYITADTLKLSMESVGKIFFSDNSSGISKHDCGQIFSSLGNVIGTWRLE